jgi:hypothetical protein
MPPPLLRAVQALYAGATYVLQDGSKRTAAVAAERGIKQGCPLSPLLFSLFLNDVPWLLEARCPGDGVACGGFTARCLMYADDLALVADSAAGLQRLLDALAAVVGGKRLAVNTEKTEVVVFNGNMAKCSAPPAFTYAACGAGGTPQPQPLRVVRHTKYLGLCLTEGCNWGAAMQGREQAMSAALAGVRQMAADLGLRTHTPTLTRLAEVFARPAGDYGDVIWATPFLLHRPERPAALEQQYVAYLRRAAGVQPSCPAWMVLHELDVEPLHLGWLRHALRFFNSGVSAAGAQASPLFAAAMAADVCLAAAARVGKHTWTGQLLAALQHICPADSSVLRLLATARVLPVPHVMELAHAVYEASCVGRGGDPRDPTVNHRQQAAYSAWFADSAAAVRDAAWGLLRRRECQQLVACRRLRLGAARLRARGWGAAALPFVARTCPACADGVSTGNSPVQDAVHVCFECPTVAAAVHQAGVYGVPRGAADFAQLFAAGTDWRGVFTFVQEAVKAAEIMTGGCAEI